MSKITKATFKSFVKKNRAKLLVNVKSKFDGMIDGTRTVNDGFAPAEAAEHVFDNNLGICGVWLVGNSRDYFTAYEKDNLKGIAVSNCCGSFVVAIPA